MILTCWFPRFFITTRWPDLLTVLQQLGYRVVDIQEHELQYNDFTVGISYEEDLLPFAQVDYTTLGVKAIQGARYKILQLRDYLCVYEKSNQDGYRITQRHKKDAQKVALIKELLETDP